ncbi:MAG: MFS transporter [Parachlamydiales bacterium]|nr:MFS transporter [Parachlamydiales bacterium]
MKKNSGAISALYLQGLIQGIAFTTIPAAGNFLTSSQGFNLTTSQYGSLFLPMILGAILSSFFGGELAKRIGIKVIFGIGGVFNIAAMAIFAALPLTNTFLPLLYIGMFLLGSGFGANLTTLNSFVLHYFPKKSSAALTALHSCLGIGTAIGPLTFSSFLKMKMWWVDPLLISAAFLILLVWSLVVFPLRINFVKTKKTIHSSHGTAHWIIYVAFASIALLYGICETTFGNWGPYFLHNQRGFSQTLADEALALFWGTLTAGRIIVVILCLSIAPKWIYRSLAPIIITALIVLLLTTNQSMALIAFALAGLGCSAFLPLTINLAQKSFMPIAQAVSGEMVAIYMLGYGLAAEGIGLIHRYTTMSWNMLFCWLILVSGLIALLTFIVARRKT